MFGSGNGGAGNILLEHNTFYNVVDYSGGPATHKNNIYAKSSSWPGYWGDKTIHPSATATFSLHLRDPTDFININNPMGPDGIPGTQDDGLRLKAGSKAIAGASDGSDIGAYPFSQDTIRKPAAPTYLTVQ